MKTEKKLKEIEIAEKIVKKYGRQNFISNLCAGELFVITKRKGMFKRPKATYLILSERCARQIIMRYKIYQYIDLFNDNNIKIVYNTDPLKNLNIKQLLMHINGCYNKKRDDEFFDIKVKKLVNILDQIFTKQNNKQNIVCVTANDETIVELYTLCAEIKKYFSSKISNEITF